MRIGVPKEIKAQESRVGLTPDSVKVLISNGHEVLVENNSGFEAGFDNDQYKKAGAKIVAVHDINLKAAEKLASVYKGAAVTNNMDKLFDVPMDALIVSTIPTVRVDPIKPAWEKNIHLIIEKPPAHNLKDGRECLAAIKKSGVMAAVGLQLRYDPRYEKLKQLLKGHVVHMVRTVTTIPSILSWLFGLTFSWSPRSSRSLSISS